MNRSPQRIITRLAAPLAMMMVMMVTMPIAPASALAPSQVQLSSQVFVERHISRPDGTSDTVLEQPKLVVPGDNLVFVVTFKNAGTQPAHNFTVTNPVPAAVAFNGTADGGETVSIDGGTNWGALATLQVTMPDQTTRPAQMADVTHVKWSLNQSLPSGSEGKVIYRGIVR